VFIGSAIEKHVCSGGHIFALVVEALWWYAKLFLCGFVMGRKFPLKKLEGDGDG